MLCFLIIHPCSRVTVCPSDVAKPGSAESAVCVLCKAGLKERVYNGIRLCYLVDSPRLCSDARCVYLRNSGNFFLKIFMTSLSIKILFVFVMYEVIFRALNVFSVPRSVSLILRHVSVDLCRVNKVMTYCVEHVNVAYEGCISTVNSSCVFFQGYTVPQETL